jgi:transcriptional regulator with XRE-family HTH domain
VVYISQDKQERKVCPAFDAFGGDLKAARKRLGFSRRVLADIVDMDMRYLAHIENDGYIPALPLFYDLVTACQLEAAKYFNQATDNDNTDSEVRKSVYAKVKLCPEQYLKIIDGALDGAINSKWEETENG